MSVLKEILAGNTDRFALKVAFMRDPDEGTSALPEMAASWGAFQIWVNGQNLCAHQEEGEQVDAVHWYLLPLLAWLVDNWDPLLHEEKLPLERQAEGAWASLRQTRFPPAAYEEKAASDWEQRWQTWWRRHCLIACRDGGLFPDVCFRRKRDEIEVSWGSADSRCTGGHQGFLVPSGLSHFTPEEVADPLFVVLTDALQFLKQQVPGSRKVDAIARELKKVELESRTDGRLAWLAGLGEGVGLSRGWNLLKRRIKGKAGAGADHFLAAKCTRRVVTGSCQAALMFGSLSPRIQRRDVLEIADKLIGLYHRPGDSKALADLMAIDLPSSPMEEPYENGYRMAEAVLQKLGLPREGDENVDVAAVCEYLGIRRGNVALLDASVRAIAVAGPKTRPGILLNTSYPFHGNADVVRFTEAHELCHLIFDRTRGKKLAIASGPWAPVGIEQRAKAFAAMFLMPPALVARLAAGLDLSSLDGLSEIAAKLKTSLSATLEHLFNIGSIDEATRDHLRAQLDHSDSG